MNFAHFGPGSRPTFDNFFLVWKVFLIDFLSKMKSQKGWLGFRMILKWWFLVYFEEIFENNSRVGSRSSNITYYTTRVSNNWVWSRWQGGYIKECHFAAFLKTIIYFVFIVEMNLLYPIYSSVSNSRPYAYIFFCKFFSPYMPY